MREEARQALALLTGDPAAVGRACGFARLRDQPHNEWMRRMILGADDFTLLAHRGSFKTTCVTLALAALMVLEPRKSLLFFRKTDRDVAEVIRQVGGLIRAPALRRLTEAVYGSPVEVARQTENELSLSCYRTPRGAVQLHGQGIGASVTGRHADLIFTDDIVNLADRASERERRRTRAFYQELQNIRNPGGRIVNTGTPWHREDAISLMPNILRCDCHATGLLTEEEIEALKAQMSPSLFAANYELRHIAAEDALFSSWPVYTGDERLLRDGEAHLDAGYGGGDCTALTCGAIRGGQLILYGRLWRCHVDAVMDEIAAECRRLMTEPLHCETNGDKGYVARELQRRGLSVRPYQERMNKHVKIATHLRKWWPRTLLLRGTDSAWTEQILSYTPEASHDDAPDSAASLIRALERRGSFAAPVCG